MEKIGGAVMGPGARVLPLSAGLRIGDTVYLSGQLAIRDGQILGETIEEQARATFDIIATVLAAASLSLKDIFKVQVWLTRAEDFAAFNSVYAEIFADPYPVRTTVISALAMPGALVEVEVTAHSSARP